MKLDIQYLLDNMTVEEKAGLCSGADFWHTKAVERLGLPAVMVSDGPHGLRKQADDADHLGINESVKAVCFPAGSAMASSWDTELISHVGDLLGEESRAENLHTLLGPAINIKRSPLCGRNFEYLSEDPLLAGKLSASYTKALQAKNVGVSVKHYAANNQEMRRMSVDTIVDERTLREIYLRAFEITTREAKPWTIMCAYNRVNGTYCCEHEWLLTDTLRKEWGFDGIVMTDWGAMNDRVASLKAGLNLEMPSSNGVNDKKIVEAINDGSLSMEVLDNSVRELLVWIERGLNDEPAIKEYDKAAHHEESRKAATQCAVLLKNENNVLPLDKGDEVVFVGPFAEKPRYQGGGSSHINICAMTSAVEAAKDLPVKYLPGLENDGETPNADKLAAAVAAAKGAKAAVLFVGLPDSYESEGYDRKHLDMPAAQNELIEAVAAVQPNTIVVLHKGSPIVMPWQDKVAAILDMYLGGQAVGGAAVDLLYGDVNPSGKLAETFPLRLEDTPCYLGYGDKHKVVYGEGVFVGYRWYDSRRMDVLYPFGYGLSYTSFAISDVKLSAGELAEGGTLTVSAKVKNTGSREGAEVVQVYIAPPAELLTQRPVQELKGFAKVKLAPGEEKTVSIELDVEAFAMYDVDQGKWYAAPGTYEVRVGNCSRSIAGTATVELKTQRPKLVYSDTMTVGDLMEAGRMDILAPLMKGVQETFSSAGSGEEGGAEPIMAAQAVQEMMGGMPLHSLLSFAPLPDGALEGIIAAINNG